MTSDTRPPNPQVEITVNGNKVPAKAFVQELIGETILAMIGTLKRVDGDVRSVEVRITKEA